MKRDEAIEKIRKLLNRHGRTDAEFDTAQVIAAALAEKHGINSDEIEAAAQAEPTLVTENVVGSWMRIPDEATYASLICQRWFEVNALQTGIHSWSEDMVFVGTAHHLQIAEYVFHFLIGEFRRCWNRRRTRSKARKSFMHGAYIALSMKLQERFKPIETPNTKALVLSLKAKREAYLKDRYPDLTTSSVKPIANRSAALQHGFSAGRAIEIRPGVDAPQAAAGSLEPGLG